MNGFDPAWLALREPADHAARNNKVRAACAAHFVDRRRITIVDLGCGAGSNLRALAPHLPRKQFWRLVDHDPVLLEAASSALGRWADKVGIGEHGLRLTKHDLQIDVEFIQADLARDLVETLAPSADLVSAAALLDLVSVAWLRAFCDLLARKGLPLYAALTCNGKERWTPPHAQDAAMRVAFHAHQARDKGFGPAAGPQAATSVVGFLAQCGYQIVEGRRDWRLDGDDRTLIRALADGVVAACGETGLIEVPAMQSWRAARREGSVTIGHIDLFATLSD